MLNLMKNEQASHIQFNESNRRFLVEKESICLILNHLLFFSLALSNFFFALFD